MARRNRVAQRQLAQTAMFPVPHKGLNANEALYNGDPESALYAYNVIARELGLQVRPGYQYWLTAPLLANTPRTLLSSVPPLGAQRDFAATSDGIYEINPNAAPVLRLAWPTPGGNAGWCSWVNYTNDAATHFLLICDEANGYYTYNAVTDTFAVGSTNPGDPTPSELVQVILFKNRVWMVRRNSTQAWYFPLNAIAGNMTVFDYGTRFQNGGYLVQLAAWTFDASQGVDDRLVAVASTGNVVIYEGTDPAVAATFNQVGAWMVGDIPAGRRVMSDWGGDTVVLSAYGIVRLSELVDGALDKPWSPSVSQRVARYFRLVMRDTLAMFGWEVDIDPVDGIAWVLSPDRAGYPPVQFAMNLTTGAWTMFRGIPARCANNSPRGFLLGLVGGQVARFTGTSDGVSPDGTQPGNGVDFSFLTHYTNLGMPGVMKQAQLVRAHWIGPTAPQYQIRVLYDFDLGELAPGQAYGADASISLWDVAVWDNAIWGSDNLKETSQLRGNVSMGRNVAVAVRGLQNVANTSAIGIEITYTTGGVL